MPLQLKGQRIRLVTYEMPDFWSRCTLVQQRTMLQDCYAEDCGDLSDAGKECFSK